MAGEKSEQPTRKRLDDARKRGQVVRSREVDSAVVLLAAYAVFRFGGPLFWDGMQSLIVDSFAQLERNPVDVELTAAVGRELVWRSIVLLLPLFAAIAGLSLIFGVLQTGGPNLSTQALKPQLKRINPLSGAKRLFASKQSYVQLVKSLLKLCVLGAVAALTLWQHWAELTALGLTADLVPSLGVIVAISFDVVVRVALVLLVIAVADYLFQRYDLQSQLRMTRQEVKDELRQSEGDPHMKAQLARMRRSLLARVMQAVPQADVVLVNPTHFAVALKYDPTSNQAPVVLAKGEELMAARIREIAAEHGIPVITNPPLTRAIYKAVPVGGEIPSDLYEAVAAVLAFVYRLRYPAAAAAAT
jgi:flagellar biosynthesis protein FlhB